ncbi:hypothetical protein FSP39_019662 [Pinctada imbricata]|uniref:RZ-type domain-containing protein n=1 Tax=Pinctada imbricata TaxID=66713 RepID=A0AA89BW69_PINIB|nr:hypothetical protein FSP39_019662 [Pinctada imbricata]
MAISQCGLWHSIHLDELRPQEKNIPDIMDMRNKGVASLMKVSDKAELTEKQHSEDWRQENSNFVPREIDDFEEDIVTMDEHLNAGQVPVERHFDIGTLIRACVQPSLAMVKDVDSTSTRATERVKILLELIHERDISGNHQFLDGLCYHLAALMKEREDKQGYRGSDWLTKEATKPENIKRAGTFRKALKQCLIDKMTPVLAGLIAFIDTNMNLDILIHDKSWKQSLWLQMFLNTKATGIEYSRMLSPGNQEELREIFVKGTSSEGQMFVSLMPFSWLIHSVVDRVDKVADKVYQNVCDNLSDVEHALEEVERVASIVLEKPIGQKLSALSGQTCVEGIKAYLSDFVRIVYPVKSDEEHQLVCESLFNGCRQIVRIDLNSMVHAITAIHVTFRLYSTRLRYFSDINRVWADCSTKVKTVQQNSAQYYLISDDELTLDVLGLHLLLENLEPGKDALNGKPGRALWLRKVHLYRPVVERILGNFKVEINDASSTFGKRCREGIFKARLQWSRVVIMKLFIEHVCASDEQDVKRIMPLWVMFKDGADMKTVASLNKIERVLTIMNKETVKYIYGCYEELMMMKSGECPVCYSPIPAEFIPSSDDSKRKIADGKYMEYRKRCNAFFMEVVSQLCFSEDMAPEPELIQKLMSYIIRQSKKGRGRVFTNEMTVFEDGLDPTPVFRSFLLQLLIRSSSEQVDQYLDQYFRQAQEIISGTPGETNQQVTELSLLIIQCLEDSLRQEVCRKADVTSEEIQEATKALRQNINHIMVEELHINKLYSLAEVRFGLTVVAKYLHKNVSEKSTHMKVNVRRMMDVAATLFDNCGFNSPKLFLIKQLCRCYGIERYYAVCNNSGPAVARWMTMPELSSNDKVVECPDRFIVNGNVYMQIRDKLTQTLLTQDVKLLENFLQSLHIPEWEVRVHLLLAIFKEVTMINIHPPDKRRTSQQDPLMKMLTSSSPWTQLPMLGITERMDLGVQNIVSLLVHFLVVILQLPSNQSFIEPLRCLSVQPQIMKNALLPTMHQDDVAEIHEALLAARRDFPNENPVLYRCPNGHPYIIGDCGRPATVGRCKECHQEIGGTGYQLKQGNVQDQGLDQTQTGHILGQPENRSTNPVPERTMSPSQCSIIRLLTHLALFTGATTNPQPLDVSTFLYRHIYVDLQCIQNALGCNLDDVYLLLHFILYNLQARHHMYENQRPEVLNLLKKDGRSSWETGFVKVYLDDILKNKDNILKKLNQGIMEDKRLGSDPLLCLLFEKDTPLQNVPATQLHNHPAVWRYRTEISVKHLQQEFLSQKTPASFPLLHNFLQEDQHLRAIRYVPSIIKLQQRLIQRYQRKLDRMEANKMIVQDILEDKDGDTIDTERLLQDFMEAWECVRERLVNFNVPVDSTKTTLPPSYCQPITMRSPLSQLLPTHRDAGLCSYVLLYFLLYKQNKFLQEYCQQTKTRYDGLPRVTLGELSPAHLIMYHPDRDIYPMLLANCSYSFEVGKGTRIEYNYHDFERQLADRFFFSKSVIKIAVEEEQLNSGVRHQIREEFRSYEEVCESLDRLDIAISFLKSDNVEPDTPLDQYLSHTLRMEYSFPSQRCKHVQSLWLTLAQLKTTYQTCYRQESFENISKEFRKDLTDNQRSMVETFTVDLIPERLAVILDILFECIVLTISIPQNPDDDDYRDMTKQSLRDELIGYLTSLPYEGYIEYELHQDWLEEMIGQIPGNSDDTSRILTEQSVDMWLLLHAIYIQKSKGR